MNMSKTIQWFIAFSTGALLMIFAIAAPAWAGDTTQDDEANASVSRASGGPSGIEPQADQILRAMSDYLKSAPELTFRADVTYDEVLNNGQKIEYGGVARAALRRPDGLHVEYRGDQRKSQAVYDGKTFTALDLNAKVYSIMKVPNEIDSALDQVFDKSGLSVPIADMLYSDPYATLTEQVESGFLVGRHAVDGKPCHHLAFEQGAIDWQIWIEDGPRPVPRKFVITYHDEADSPQYSVTFKDWDFQPRLTDDYFRFTAPPGADQVEILPPQEGMVDTETEP